MSNPLTKKALAHPRTTVGLVAVLVAVGVLGHGFTFDDHYTVEFADGLDRPLGELLRLFVRGEATARGLSDATRPLVPLTTWFERRLFGASPLGYHAVSLLLHGLVAAVATALATVLTRDRRMGLVAGLFFALAPVHAEVVASVHFREDLFATLGLFLALLLLLVPVPAQHPPMRALAACAALALGLLGKESAAIFPIVFVVLARAAGFGRASLLARERSFTAVVCVLIVYGLFRYALALGDDGVARGPALAPIDRLATTGRYLLWCVRATLVPFAVTPFHEPEGRASHAYLLVLPLAAIVVLRAMHAAGGRRPLALGLALVLLLPLPSAPITLAANEQADRYLYGAVLGAGIVHATLLRALLDRGFVAPVRIAAGLVALALLVQSVRTIAVFRDDRRLFEYAVSVSERSARAQLAVAWARRLDADLAGADAALDAAERLEPDSPRVALARGMLALARGDREEAAAIAEAIDARHGRIPGLVGLERCAARAPEAAMRCGRSIRMP